MPAAHRVASILVANVRFLGSAFAQSGDAYVRVASLEDLRSRASQSPEVRAVKFDMKLDEEDADDIFLQEEGFVFYSKSKVIAYLNKCAHMSLELDMDDADFFTLDGSRIQCKVHGAQFCPDSGVCVEGPCKSKMLTPLNVKVDGDDVLVAGADE